MAFRCDAAFAEVRTKEETADCMHALMCFSYNIVGKVKTLLFIHLRPIQDFKGQVMTQNINSMTYSLIGSLLL